MSVEEKWLEVEVEVTIETRTEEKARYKVDRVEFEQWAGNVPEDKLAAKIKEYLQAGDDWEVCAEVHAAAGGPGEVVDCEILRVTIPKEKP